jgi:hypothetical protein
MKYIFLFFLTAVLACTKHVPPVASIPVTDGMVYMDTLTPKRDSLKYFQIGLDTFLVEMRFTKYSSGYPLPDQISHVDNALSEYVTLLYTPADYSGDNIINPIGWNFSKDQIFNLPHHENTLSFLQTDGWLDYKFMGYKIEYYAERFESYGVVGVSIDGKRERGVDLYAPVNYNNSTAVFIADSLDQSVEHTIRLRYTGQRNPKSNNTNARINFDKFVIYFSQGVAYKSGTVDRQGKLMKGSPGLDKPNPRATRQYELPKTSN